MSLLWSASFDLDTTTTDDWDFTSFVSIIPAAARNGLNGCRANQNTAVMLGKIIPNTQTSILGTAWRLVGSVTGSEPIFQWTDGATQQGVITVNPDGTVTVWRGAAGVALQTSNLKIGNLANIFHYIQCKMTIASAPFGACEILVDGVTMLSASGLNTQASANAYASQLNICGNSITVVGGSADFDDVYFCDTTGNQNNNYLGDVTVVGQVPVANGTQNSFAQGGTTHAQNWQQVSEVPPDDDTTYVFDNNIGDEEGYTYGALAQTGANVYAVAFKPRMRKDQSGTRSVKLAHLSQGVETYNGTDIPLSQSYATQYFQQPLDPATGQLWTIAGVNGCEQRIRITA